jgi:hypothetical protein
MEVIFSFETSVYFQRTTQCYIEDNSSRRNYRFESLNTYNLHFTGSEIVNRKFLQNEQIFRYFIDNANVSRRA